MGGVVGEQVSALGGVPHTKNCRLAALDKRSSVRPVGITSVWDLAVCKLALSAMGLNAKAACRSK